MIATDGVVLDALNPAGRPSLLALRDLGVGLARLVAFADARFTTYERRLRRAGIETAVVLARESFPDDNVARWAEWYAKRIAPDWWVLGNEPDAYLLPEESPSSWSMTPGVYLNFMTTCRNAILHEQPDARLCIGGLVSGGTDWLRGLGPLGGEPRYVDVHPYAKIADDACELIRATARIHGQRPLVLEWHRPLAEIVGFAQMLRQETIAAAYFCWSDQMVGGFGLIDDGAPTASYWVLKGAYAEGRD